MNPRLSESASPYLRAHADNPVDWWAWGDDAFAEARRRDVPVLVSIGYSTCHWCHVMARESFADAETAALVNAGFVAIKVDREEHPDVDSAYMAAAAAFTPHLGWPLTVFTTPDGGPFYAGTYFPPEPRAGMPSFRQVLAAVRAAWTDRRAAAEGTAAAIAEALAASAAEPPVAAERAPGVADLAASARAVAAREDREFGGFGGGDPAAPKFPVATALRLLQSRVVRAAEPAASAVVSRALAAMAASPLHDTVEGGFFRYATRRDWSMPHFEKMLVDNAQLLDVATDEGDAATARDIAGYLLDVLQRPGGGFAAAQDSESWIDGVRSEGGYYARDAAARAALEPPAVDGKVVTGWNGLAMGALARAGARWGEPRWIEAGARAAEAVLARNVDATGRLVRASLDGRPSTSLATLADHGQFAEGLVALAVATGDPAHAVSARTLVSACLTADGAPAAPGGTDPVLAASGLTPPGAAADADEPSGAAAIAAAAAALSLLGDGLLGDGLLDDADAMRALAARIVATHAPAALAQPFAHGALLRVAALLAHAPRQVVVVTEGGDDSEDPLVTAARGIRADVVAIVTPAQADAWARAGFGLFEGKTRQGARSTAYDCRSFVCRLPVTRAEELEG